MTLTAMIMRLFLSVILIRAALHKMRDRKNFEAELSAYQLLPESCLSLTTYALILTETLTAITLLNGEWRLPALVAALLFLVYAFAMAINLFRGRHHIDCGCAGPLLSSKQYAQKTISWSLVFRNLILVSFSLLSAATLAVQYTSALEPFIILAGSAVTLLLYETIEQAIANAQGYQRWKH